MPSFNTLHRDLKEIERKVNLIVDILQFKEAKIALEQYLLPDIIDYVLKEYLYIL
jgi:hypothetical protein